MDAILCLNVFLVDISIPRRFYVVCSAKALVNPNYGPNFELFHSTILAKKYCG